MTTLDEIFRLMEAHHPDKAFVLAVEEPDMQGLHTVSNMCPGCTKDFVERLHAVMGELKYVHDHPQTTEKMQ